jgi:predicted nucleic acid-binding protein
MASRAAIGLIRRYLLGTHVVSELRRPGPHGAFGAWLESVADDDLQYDAMIAATARVHRLTDVTGSVRDFSGYEVNVLNPFKPARD